MSQGEKIYLRPGEVPPPGVQVYVGPRGGRYYFAAGRAGASRPQPVKLSRIVVPEDRTWEGLRSETRASNLVRQLESTRLAIELARKEIDKALARGNEVDHLQRDLYVLQENELSQQIEIREHLASGEADWLDFALAAEARPEDFTRIRPLGGENVQTGIHAVHTNIVELARPFWVLDPGMHSTRAVYKCGMLPGRFEESHGEMAAWVMSEILELGICPEVRYANPGRDERWGHVMRWLDHAGERGAKAVVAMRYDPARKYQVHDRDIRRDIVRMFVLDALGNNGDRHFGNWIVHHDLRRAFAIDNGFMFRNNGAPDSLSELVPTRILITLGGYSRDDYEEFNRIVDRLAERRDALVSAVKRIFSLPDTMHRTPDEISRRLQEIETGLQRRIDLLISSKWDLPSLW